MSSIKGEVKTPSCSSDEVVKNAWDALPRIFAFGIGFHASTNSYHKATICMFKA